MAIIATYTNTYKLGQFLGDSTYDPTIEGQRWNTVDANLGALSGLLGDGIVSGWDVGYDTSYIYVSPGSGIINHWACETTATTLVDLDINLPNYYVLALADISQTYYNQYVDMVTDDSDANPLSLPLVKFSTNSTASITSFDTSYNIRRYAGIDATSLAFINNHIHDGLSNSNSAGKINLSTDVTGLLPAIYIGNIPSDKITGNINLANLPPIPHDTLLDSGNISHTAIDEFMGAIDYQTIGEVALTNGIQQSIALTHALGTEAVKYLINEKEIVPGITTYSIDFVNSIVATVNTDLHQIIGTYAATITPVTATRMWAGKTGDYGFLNPNNVTSNLDMTLAGGNYLHLARETAIDRYYTTGYIQLDFYSGVVSNWRGLTIYNTQPDTTSMYIQFQPANSKELVKPALYSTQMLIPTSSYFIDLTPINDDKVLSLKITLNGPITSDLTPVLNSLILNYDTNSNARSGYFKVDTRSEFSKYITTYSNTDYNALPGSILLQKYTEYYPTGIFTSTYLDGGTSLVKWNKLYTDYHKPEGTDILWTVKSATTIGSLVGIAWTTPVNSVNGLYDISDQTNRYLQVQADFRLPSYSLNSTPELLETVITRYNEIGTSIATSLQYYRWSLTGSGDEGYTNSTAYLNNITPTYYTNAITVSDNSKDAIWESEWKLIDNNFIQLKELSIYGENFAQENLVVKAKLSTNPSTDPIDEITLTGTVSPLIVDLSSYNAISGKKLYIKVNLNLKSNVKV